MASLEDFKCIKKLSVKNLEIRKRRVKADYVLSLPDGSTDKTELIYSYEDNFFNPEDSEDINLASVMLAQVAFNYGLFSEVIEFDGLFDETDKQFIRSMTENTSREIISNKLLIDNPFLKEEFRNPIVKKQDRYTAARLDFVNTGFPDKKIENSTLEYNPNAFAILSSGGKDSLLSYGLAQEFGEVHPVFINESGRHWFTAVNAHRHFKEIEPNTVKPWCNSDRVFNWMLRRMPFIKENYNAIRADIYPLRLWTVAVFLFGVLPVVKARKIGNVIIGDEYDTTVRSVTQGITHYAGLYDQSKYFDNALSRYFKRKGWAIRQYSFLRSLSELLIMKVLIERYPQLQKHQISCHAAHEEQGRMYPCGNCEKCRRIIGMITALEQDASNCGYSKDQIRKGLEMLSYKSVKQIGSDAAHLYYLLLSKSKIEDNEFTRKAARAHPEIMKLRFDQERSTPEDLPMQIRKKLFNILVNYSDGVVLRQDRNWIDIDLDDAFLLSKKYIIQE